MAEDWAECLPSCALSMVYLTLYLKYCYLYLQFETNYYLDSVLKLCYLLWHNYYLTVEPVGFLQVRIATSHQAVLSFWSTASQFWILKQYTMGNNDKTFIFVYY